MAATGRAAIRYGFGEPFKIREFPVPECEPGSVLIKISLANICGSDLHTWRGDTRSARAAPRHQGHEGTGRVVMLGDGVSTDSNNKPLAVGDRVIWSLFYPCGNCRACLYGREWCCPNAFNHVAKTSCEMWPHFRGTFGDYHYLFPRHTVFKVPDELPDELVAGLNCAMTQVTCGWDVAGLTLGEQVVIQGAGGLGIYAIAVARERGAGKIIVIDGVAERLDLAAAFGADELIDMRELPELEQRIARVKELTDGWGADVVMEVVGFPPVVQEGLQMVGSGGRYVEIGNISSGHTFAADPSLWVQRNITIFGNLQYSRRHLREALQTVHRTRHKYPFHRIISHKFPLEQINEAMAAQNKGHVTRASLVP